MMTRLLAVVLILSCIPFANAIAAPPDYPIRNGPPSVLLKEGVDKLTGFIRSGSAANPAQAMAFLEAEIAPYFDFPYMTRWAAGPAWRSMNPEMRARLQEQLTRSFLNTLVHKVTSYTNQPIRYFTPRGQRGNEIRVSAWIMQPVGYPTRLDFRFYLGANGWKIFDVSADGNSAVLHYRRQFRNSLRQDRPVRRY